MRGYQKDTNKKINTEVKAREKEADGELKKGEKKARDEKKYSEKKARDEKKRLKKQSKKKSWWDRAVDAVKSAVKAVTAAIGKIFDALRKAVSAIIDAAKKLALAAIEAARKFAIAALETFGNVLKGLVSTFVGTLFPGLAKRINKAIDSTVDKAKKAVNAVADKLKKGVEALADALKKGLNKILDAFETALTAAVQIVGALVTGDFVEALKIAIRAACKIAGINPDTVFKFIDKAGNTVMKILKDPIQFVKNVGKGVSGGIKKFQKNIKKHLINGLIGWLTGAMSDVPIQLPQKWDMKGIIDLVLQILGLTYDQIRAKVVKALGPKGETIVGTLEKTAGVLKKVYDAKSPKPLIDMAKEKFNSVKDQAMEKIRGVVTLEVVKAGIKWLISLLNPASAIVKAVIMLFDVSMFLIERKDQIISFVTSVYDTLAPLANGQTGKAAAFIEKAMAKSVPMILGMLASVLGLGGIGKSVSKVIKAIRKPVDKVIDPMINGIVNFGKRLLGKGNPKKGKKVGSESDVTPVERKKHQKIAETIATNLKQPDPKAKSFGLFYNSRRDIAKKLQKDYSKQLRKGLKLSIDFQDMKKDIKDNDVDFTIKIAPNTTIITTSATASGDDLDKLEGAPVPASTNKEDHQRYVTAAYNQYVKHEGKYDDTAAMDALSQKIKKRYGLEKAELKNESGKEVINLKLQKVERKYVLKDLMIAGESTGVTLGKKTKVVWASSSLGGATVGVHMKAEALGVDHPKGSETSGNQPSLMNKLPQEIEATRAPTINHKYIRGHLLNAEVGGPGKDNNLFPITARANKDHEALVEHKIKQWVNIHKYWVRYEVHVANITSSLADTDKYKNSVKCDFVCAGAILGVDKEYHPFKTVIKSAPGKDHSTSKDGAVPTIDKSKARHGQEDKVTPQTLKSKQIFSSG